MYRSGIICQWDLRRWYYRINPTSSRPRCLAHAIRAAEQVPGLELNVMFIEGLPVNLVIVYTWGDGQFPFPGFVSHSKAVVP